jgi:hypothetical protein
MNISKFFITSATAMGIVGTIGFAVAQTTAPGDNLANPATGATTTMQPTPMQPTPMETPSVMPASPMVNSETSMTTERAPQADRN